LEAAVLPQVNMRSGHGVVCNSDIDICNLSPCTHEEADTRILLHAVECAMQEFNTVVIRTVDTDVMIIAISMFQHLGLSELWIAFGTGKNFHYVPIRDIVKEMGPTKARSLTAFHAFTWRDQTSSFVGIDKNTAWATWKVYDEITSAFVALSLVPREDRLKEIMPEIEHFVALMYDRTSTSLTVNEARKDLFTRKDEVLRIHHQHMTSWLNTQNGIIPGWLLLGTVPYTRSYIVVSC